MSNVFTLICWILEEVGGVQIFGHFKGGLLETIYILESLVCKEFEIFIIRKGSFPVSKILHLATVPWKEKFREWIIMWVLLSGSWRENLICWNSPANSNLFKKAHNKKIAQFYLISNPLPCSLARISLSKWYIYIFSNYWVCQRKVRKHLLHLNKMTVKKMKKMMKMRCQILQLMMRMMRYRVKIV